MIGTMENNKPWPDAVDVDEWIEKHPEELQKVLDRDWRIDIEKDVVPDRYEILMDVITLLRKTTSCDHCDIEKNDDSREFQVFIGNWTQAKVQHYPTWREAIAAHRQAVKLFTRGADFQDVSNHLRIHFSQCSPSSAEVERAPDHNSAVPEETQLANLNHPTS